MVYIFRKKLNFLNIFFKSEKKRGAAMPIRKAGLADSRLDKVENLLEKVEPGGGNGRADG